MDPDVMLLVIGVIIAVIIIIVALKLIHKMPSLNEVIWRWRPSAKSPISP